MITAPKVVQSICAALGDYYTWKLAGRIYGKRSRISQVTVLANIAAILSDQNDAYIIVCAARPDGL